MNISRNGNRTTLRLTKGEVASLVKAEEIARTVAFVRGVTADPTTDGLKELLFDVGDTQTITVDK